MASDRPILILTASAGAGHTVAAKAIEDELRRQLRNVTIEVHDTLQHANAFFRNLYSRGYLGLVNYAPAAMGMLYDATDRPRKRRRDMRSAFQNINVRKFVRFLIDRKPRLIINTHFLPAEIVAQLRRKGRLDCPQVTVTTDFETHRLWAQQPTERYYTATEDGKAYLQTWNVPERDILVTGIPIRAAFEQPLDRVACRARLGVSHEAPLILLLAGGFGVGPTESLFGELSRMPAAAQIVVVTGKNEALRARLEAIRQAMQRPTRIVGFTDEMHLWMQAADLLVTKPGGLTTAEALACGLPMVIVNPIPGQETRNSDYLLENGAAIKVNNARLLGYRVSRLLDCPDRFASLARAARLLARPGAAGRIVADAISLISE